MLLIGPEVGVSDAEVGGWRLVGSRHQTEVADASSVHSFGGGRGC